MQSFGTHSAQTSFPADDQHNQPCAPRSPAFLEAFQYPIVGCYSLYDLLASSHLHSVTQAGLVIVVVAGKMHYARLSNCRTLLLLGRRAQKVLISLVANVGENIEEACLKSFLPFTYQALMSRSPRATTHFQLHTTSFINYLTTNCTRLNAYVPRFTHIIYACRSYPIRMSPSPISRKQRGGKAETPPSYSWEQLGTYWYATSSHVDKPNS